jgi:alpha-mannosidase
MTYRESYILLPCHGLEDFPLHHEGDDAAGLLAAWTALWHPALLAAAGARPNWRRGDNPPSDLEGRLILAPGVSSPEIPTGFAERATTEGACWIQGNLSRDEILRRALEPLRDQTSAIDEDVAADFLALGYCYLQVELLTRQMRYSTNLDESHFFQQVVAGAKAAVAGHTSEAKDRLSACFDLLAQERAHYYAVDAYLLDVTLLAPHTIGAALAAQLAPGIPTNVVLTGQLLADMREQAPESFAALRHALAEGYLGLMGGESQEARSPLHSCETVLRRFQSGLRQYDQLLAARPRVYARRHYGVSVLYPQLLHRLGYTGALHAALGEGKYPEGSQVKIRWQGPDHSAIDSIGRVPLDASRPETFLALASKLGATMDVDHVATVCLAHWPGQVSPWYHDLRRIARYGAMLGKFVTADQYFRDTGYPGTSERFKSDQYHSPCLPQAVSRQQRDPLSTSVRYWRRHATLRAAQALDTLVTLIRNCPQETAPSLWDEVDACADDAGNGALDEQVARVLADRLGEAAGLVGQRADQPEPGYLLWNPSTAVRRIGVDLPQLRGLPEVIKPIYAAASEGEHCYVVADVPAMGYAWIQGGAANSPARRGVQLLAEGHRIFNEFFEAHISPTTGALQAMHAYEQRGNRLSQQLAMRIPPASRRREGSGATYSVMVADSVKVSVATSAMGEITSSGRLLSPRGELLASFRQRYRVWRGSRVLQVSIELDPAAHPGDDPWESYYACRFAWSDDTAELWRGVNELRERAEAKRLEAPLYIDIDEGGTNVVILTGGLPFHRRTDPRMLDSLLIVRGERSRSFEMGIGMDVKYPLSEAMALLTPPTMIPRTAGPPVGSAQGWMFHLDSRNVTATSWTPLVQDGCVRGFRVRLLETGGRTVHTRLRAYRAVSAAYKLDFAGQTTGSCPVRDGSVAIDLGSHEWLELEARW